MRIFVIAVFKISESRSKNERKHQLTRTQKQDNQN